MGKKALIIEDDIDTAHILGYLLEDLHFEVTYLYGVLPYPDICEITPDLILLDHKLGDGYGSQLCEEIKSKPITRAIPVFMVSANPMIENITKKCGADAFLAKPFDINQFLSAVSELSQ